MKVAPYIAAGLLAMGMGAPLLTASPMGEASSTVPVAPSLATLADWQASFGEPTRSVAASEAARTEGEPLLIYWMQVKAAPLGVGPATMGTLVANFNAHSPVEASPLQGFTFLAMADPAATEALVSALTDQGWVKGETLVTREGGPFKELSLTLPHGRSGTLAIRQGQAKGQMADGRPSPAFWLHVSPTQGAD